MGNGNTEIKFEDIVGNLPLGLFRGFGKLLRTGLKQEVERERIRRIKEQLKEQLLENGWDLNYVEQEWKNNNIDDEAYNALKSILSFGEVKEMTDEEWIEEKATMEINFLTILTASIPMIILEIIGLATGEGAEMLAFLIIPCLFIIPISAWISIKISRGRIYEQRIPLISFIMSILLIVGYVYVFYIAKAQ